MSRSPITVVMTTYFPPGEDGASRVGVAKIALVSWRKFLHYQGEIRLHVADDGSAPEHEQAFMRFAHDADSYSVQERHGVGASLNAGFRAAMENGISVAKPTLVMYAVDDWELLEGFDLTPWADLLVEREDVGMVRFGIGHPGVTGVFEMFPSGWAMRLDRHHFAFATRPALYHSRMILSYGWFDEDVNAFECERAYNERFCDPQVVAGHERMLETPSFPSILFALPSPWQPVEGSVELADVDPRV